MARKIGAVYRTKEVVIVKAWHKVAIMILSVLLVVVSIKSFGIGNWWQDIISFVAFIIGMFMWAKTTGTKRWVAR